MGNSHAILSGTNDRSVILYGLGTLLIAAISAVFIFGAAQRMTASTEALAGATSPVGMTALPADRLVRIVLASPYER